MWVQGAKVLQIPTEDYAAPLTQSTLPSQPVGTAQVQSARAPGFWERHQTGITVFLFCAGCVGLGVAPLPENLKPFELTKEGELEQMVKRVLHRPKLRFVKIEEEPAEVVPSEPGEDEVITTAIIPRFDKAPEKVVLRQLQKRVSEKTLALRSLAKSLRGEEIEVQNPCLQKSEGICERTALDPFFASLDAVRDQELGTQATIVTLGNSLIASDHVTDKIRERLVFEFGSGGRGFLLPDRLSKQGGRRVRTGRGTEGWIIHTFAQSRPKRSAFGFAGSMHESTRNNDRIRWQLRGARSAQLYWLDHKDAASFSLEADGVTLAQINPKKSAEPQDRIFNFEVPPGSKELVLRAEGKGVVLYGVALSNDRPGVVFDTIGVPASDAKLYMSVDQGRFERQLSARDPSMVIVMVGGNETRSLAFKKATPDEVRTHYSNLLDRVKKSAPGASCLAVSPIDAAKATAAGAELATRPELLKVVAIEKEVAAEKDCAYFDLFAAMGGKGSLQRYHRRGLVNADLVHPKGKGGDVLGTLVADALMASYVKTPPPKKKLKRKKRLVRPLLAGLQTSSVDVRHRPEAQLDSLYRAFKRSEGPDRKARVSVGVFGDEHIEGGKLVAQIRQRLQDRFGDRGHGFIALGDEGELGAAKISRDLRAPFEVTDGREVAMGGAVSMAGKKVRLLPGGSMNMHLCRDCDVTSASGFRRSQLPSQLDIAWLYTPGMGSADVYVNDVLVGEISAAAKRGKSDVQFFSVSLRGESHTLSIKARPSADLIQPVDLLSIAHEMQEQGVVMDAVGLTGATAMTPQRWRKELVREQILRRHYDAVVFAWGGQESTLDELDALTYAHHARNTYRTILDASPGASCVMMLPPPKVVDKKRAPRLTMVRQTQRELARELGCVIFSSAEAMGGKRAYAMWKEEGLLNPTGQGFSDEGYARWGDLLAADVISLYDYAQARREEERVALSKESDAQDVARTDDDAQKEEKN